MKKSVLFLLTVPLLAACGGGQVPPETADGQQASTEAISMEQPMAGDSSLYGLACDGCTDSVLVVLPLSGGDPDTLDVTEAFEQRHVLGRPRVGDEIAVIWAADSAATNIAEGDTAVAPVRRVAMTVNMSRLVGQWCYEALPELKMPAGAPALPDSIRQRLMVPREYGLRLKRDRQAHSTGFQMQQSGSQRVVYPTLKRYEGWHLWNGRLVLTIDSASREQPDTADIVLLRRDSLVLRIGNKLQGYYKK